MMKKHIFKATAGVLTALSITLAGCSDFLDVNDNPNQTTEALPSLILPSAQAAVGIVLGNTYQVYGSMWSQYWTQNRSSSQYKSVDQFLLQGSNFDRPWQLLYADGMEDLQLIINQANAEPVKQYAAAAMILKAYELQMLTDAFGDIPNREALQGEQLNLNPHYDSQESVYDSIFALINRGISLIDASSEYIPGDEDMIFQGDMDKWEAFGNTLKLRAYLRLSEVNPTKAQAGIATLAGATFLTEDAAINYTSTGGNQNPLYAEMVGLGRTQNLVASETAVNQMKALSDPRLLAFYQNAAGTTTVNPIPQGSFNTPPSAAYPLSLPSPNTGAAPRSAASALAPVKFMSAAESYFLQAEAAARGWLAGDARGLFEDGITASFEAYNVTPGAYITTAVAAFPASGLAAQLKAIITQKYFAMNGNQGFEAWSEWRRTGYPDFFVRSVESSLPAGQFPARFLYPNTELTRNPNFPGAKVVTDKVWWDK
ncbi:SusD/RagB family nutrient-binding outer membrane lipoprotein [Chitinophaga pinensis]|nr:SusD/RagB family nutrient-binding outer membrane lipoprotein [Chitinophaga pinensis]